MARQLCSQRWHLVGASLPRMVVLAEALVAVCTRFADICAGAAVLRMVIAHAEHEIRARDAYGTLVSPPADFAPGASVAPECRVGLVGSERMPRAASGLSFHRRMAASGISERLATECYLVSAKVSVYDRGSGCAGQNGTAALFDDRLNSGSAFIRNGFLTRYNEHLFADLDLVGYTFVVLLCSTCVPRALRYSWRSARSGSIRSALWAGSAAATAAVARNTATAPA